MIETNLASTTGTPPEQPDVSVHMDPRLDDRSILDHFVELRYAADRPFEETVPYPLPSRVTEASPSMHASYFSLTAQNRRDVVKVIKGIDEGDLSLLRDQEEMVSAEDLRNKDVLYAMESVVSPETIVRSWRVYQQLHKPVLESHPQVACMNIEEFVDAMFDPDVGKLWFCDVIEKPQHDHDAEKADSDYPYIDHSQEVYIPAIAPVRSYSWLSQRYYSENPRMKGKPVAHLAYLPGLLDELDTLPPLFIRHISQILHNKGVLTFDAPAQDGGYVKFVQDMVERELSGLQQDTTPSVSWLGSQHYFAGKLQFVDAREEWEDSPSFMDTYYALIASGDIQPPTYFNKGLDGVTAEAHLDEPESMKWWPIYEQGFEPINLEHPCRQGLSQGEFIGAMANPEIMKSISYDDGDPVSLVFMGPDLTAFPWVSADYFKAHPVFGPEMERGKVMYFPGLVTDEAKKGSIRSSEVIRLLGIVLAASHNAVTVMFDTCDKNQKNVPRAAEIGVARSGICRLKVQEIATHNYYAIDFSQSA